MNLSARILIALSLFSTCVVAQGIPLNFPLDVKVSKPLDGREQVATFADLATVPFKYEGLVTEVLATGVKHRWDGSQYIEIVTGGGGAVDAVNGQTGAVSLDTDDVPEGANLYYPLADAARLAAMEDNAINQASVEGLLDTREAEIRADIPALVVGSSVEEQFLKDSEYEVVSSYTSSPDRLRQNNILIERNATWKNVTVHSFAIWRNIVYYSGGDGGTPGDPRQEMDIGAFLLTSPYSGVDYPNNPIVSRESVGLGAESSGVAPYDVVEYGDSLYIFVQIVDANVTTVGVMTAPISDPLNVQNLRTVMNENNMGNTTVRAPAVMIHPEATDSLLVYFGARDDGQHRILLARVALAEIADSNAYVLLRDYENPVVRIDEQVGSFTNYPYPRFIDGEYEIWYNSVFPGTSLRSLYRTRSGVYDTFPAPDQFKPVLKASEIDGRKDEAYASVPRVVGNTLYYSGRPRPNADYQAILAVEVPDYVPEVVGGGESVWAQNEGEDVASYEGSVGVGTNDPTRKLEVYDESSTVYSRVQRGNGVGMELIAGGTVAGFAVSQGRGNDPNAQTYWRLQGQTQPNFAAGNTSGTTDIIDVNTRAPLNSLKIFEDGSVTMRPYRQGLLNTDSYNTVAVFNDSGDLHTSSLPELKSRMADNLGDHTATEDIDLGGFVITNAGNGANGTDLIPRVQIEGLIQNYLDAAILSANSTLDFPDTPAGTSSDLTIAITGAVLNDAVSVGAPDGSVLAASNYTAWVSTGGVVTVRFNNYSTGSLDPGSGLFQVRVVK